MFQEETQNSAALGAAFRARYVSQGGEDKLSFSESVGKPQEQARCITPHKDAKSVYRPILERFKRLENSLCKNESKQ